MYALKNDFFYDIDDLTDVIRPRRKTLLDRLVGRYAAGQIGRLKAWSSDMAHRHQQRRAALEMSRLDDRMLKDLGITRAEIEVAVSGALIRGRHD